MPRNTARDEHDQPDIPPLSEEQHDSTILHLMLCDDSGVPWSMEELARGIDHTRVGANDAVNRLHAAGLVHRTGDFVWPSLAARRADELAGGVA